MSKTLTIKPEYKNLIRPLTQKEYLQLEENILRDGCLNPIITWNGFIIDGHNRYEICTKHRIPFQTKDMNFDSNEEVIAWICANQLGRRNISEETRKFLIGMQYESEKIIAERRNPTGINQYSDTADITKSDVDTPPYSERSHRSTALRIATENHISAATVQKYARFTRALEIIGSKEPELVPKILSGRYKVSHNNIMELAELSSSELSKINKQLNRRRNPYFPYAQTRSVISQSTPDTPPSIKDMPDFDPDALVTELSLTMPSWISSIQRTRNNANLSIITPQAREKLSTVLSSMKDIVEELLSAIKEGY